MLLLSLGVGRGTPKLDLEGCVGAFQLVGKIGEEEVRAHKEAVIRLRRNDSVVPSAVSEAQGLSTTPLYHPCPQPPSAGSLLLEKVRP